MDLDRVKKLNKLRKISLYKYLPNNYSNDFINKGDILFRNLTYFNKYEDNNKRGDIYDGGVYHKSVNGFEVINLSQNNTLTVKESFVDINTDNIFVCCFSKKLDKDLFKEFNSDCCIEIVDAVEFTKRIGRNLENKYFDYDDIDYYKTDEIHHYLLNKPKAIPFQKTTKYEHQDEYRYIFSDFTIKSKITFSTLSITNQHILKLKQLEKQENIKLGSLNDIVKIHFS